MDKTLNIISSGKLVLDDCIPSKLKVYRKQNIIKLIVSNYINGKNETDSLFPPDVFSLESQIKNESLSKEDLESYHIEKTWHRVIEIFDNLNISSSNFSPYDIKQGALGDCYFLSALAALARFPQIIQNLFVFCDLDLLKSLHSKNLKDQEIISQIFMNFRDLNDNDQDCLSSINSFYTQNYERIKLFFMKIRVHGEWKIILLDDFLPTYNDTSELVFAKSLSKDLWVPLIEKIWAKLLGGYYRTSLGSPAEALYCLTDAPTTVITHNNLDNSKQLWEKIKIKKDWILSVIIQLKGNKAPKYHNLGLSTNHCYSIIRLSEVSVDRKNYYFLLLRNPYGYNKWKGNYSDDSTLWTKALKDAVKFNEKDEGCFWVSLEDYFQLFDHTFLCKYEKDFVSESYKISKEEIKSQTSAFIVKLSNEKERQSLVYFTLHQKYKRIYNKKKKNVMANLIISRIENPEEINLINFYENKENSELNTSLMILQNYCCGNNNKSVTCYTEFDNGYYIILAQIHFFDFNDYATSFVLSSYADKNTNIKLKLLKNYSPKLILEKSLLSIAQTKCEREYYDDDNSFKVISLNNNESGYGIIYFENHNKEAKIDITIKCSDFTNMKAINFTFDKDNSAHLEIPPTGNCLYYFRKLKMKCGFKFKLIENFVLPISALKSTIKQNGEKKELQLSKANCKVFFYTMTHSRGYLLLIENLNYKTFSGLLKFSKLENLFCNQIINGTVEILLKYKEQKFIELNRIDNTKKVGMAHGLSFKLI
jgi:hypothetical protein